MWQCERHTFSLIYPEIFKPNLKGELEAVGYEIEWSPCPIWFKNHWTCLFCIDLPENQALLSQSYKTYVDLLVKLDNLDQIGKENTPEADAIRDQMDAPWYKMTDEEHWIVGKLSEELYKKHSGPRMHSGYNGFGTFLHSK